MQKLDAAPLKDAAGEALFSNAPALMPTRILMNICSSRSGFSEVADRLKGSETGLRAMNHSLQEMTQAQPAGSGCDE